MADTIDNERIKLTATAISNIAIGILVVGLVTPLLHGDISFNSLLIALFSILFSVKLHRVARDYLGGLQ